jgi:hypothetical protein
MWSSDEWDQGYLRVDPCRIESGRGQAHWYIFDWDGEVGFYLLFRGAELIVFSTWIQNWTDRTQVTKPRTVMSMRADSLVSYNGHGMHWSVSSCDANGLWLNRGAYKHSSYDARAVTMRHVLLQAFPEQRACALCCTGISHVSLAGRGPMLRTAETSPLYQIMHLYKKIKCKINKLWVSQNSWSQRLEFKQSHSMVAIIICINLFFTSCWRVVLCYYFVLLFI